MTKLNGMKRDLGAYRTPEVPERRDPPPLEPFTKKCPTCRKKYDIAAGYPRGRDVSIVIGMKGSPFNRHMVMLTSEDTETAIDFAPPERRAHVAKACTECHVLRIMKEPPPRPESGPEFIGYVIVLALMTGFALGMFVRRIMVDVELWP